MDKETDVLHSFYQFPDFEVEDIVLEKRKAKQSHGTKDAVVIKGKVVYNRSKIVCPKCGGVPDEDGKPTFGTYGNGTRPREVQDIPAHGYSLTFLSYRTPDFLCLNPECKHSFSPTFSFVEKNGQKTKRFKDFLVDLAFKKLNFSDVSELYDVDSDQLETWFLQRVEALDKKREYTHVPHLGIDEKTIDGKSYIVVLDTSTSPASVIDIAPGGKTIKGFKDAILKIKNHMQIETITIDMCNAYYSALDSLYPNRTEPVDETGEVIGPRVIIDRFHVVQHLMDAVKFARRTLWEERKEIIANIPDGFERAKAFEIWGELNKVNHLWFYKNLDDLKPGSKGKLLRFCEEYPEFAQLIAIKEEFKDIFDTSVDSEEAELRYADWMYRVPTEKAAYSGFLAFFGTVKDHYREIFNYFMDPVGKRYSNGAVEAKNSIIGEVICKMRGARFEIIRGKVLYGQTRSSDLKKVPEVSPKYLLDDKPTYSMCLDMFLSGLREDYVTDTVYTIMERCAAEAHMEHNKGCTYEDALQHIRETGFIDHYILNSIGQNNNIQGRMEVVAETMDTEALKPILCPIPQQEFLNRFLCYAAEANLESKNDLSVYLSSYFEDDEDGDLY